MRRAGQAKALAGPDQTGADSVGMLPGSVAGIRL